MQTEIAEILVSPHPAAGLFRLFRVHKAPITTHNITLLEKLHQVLVYAFHYSALRDEFLLH